jgi:arginase family enzyme
MPNRQQPKPFGLTTYCARAGDHNDLAMSGAMSVGGALSQRLGIPVTIIGVPDTPLSAGWKAELAAAMPALSALAKHLDGLFRSGLVPLLALSRCAASLATLPVVLRHRPDACVVWFDAHGDLNTPNTSLTSYLGGMALAGPAGLWNSGLGNGLALANLILVGARDLDPAEQALVDADMVRLIPPKGEYLTQLRSALGGRPAYIHLDCDVLEPGIVPTDYRVPGGFELAELRAVCKALAEVELVGLEIAEFENAWSRDEPPVSPAPLLDALEPLIAGHGMPRNGSD